MKKILALTMVVISAVLIFFPGGTLALDIQQAGVSDGDFTLFFQPDKKTFEVGEPITFSVKGTKDFYLYLFTIAPNTGIGHVILPNKLQPDTFYNAGQKHSVPDETARFVNQHAGKERILVVASTEKLKFSIDQFKMAGNFAMAGAGEVETQVKALSLSGIEQKRQVVSQEVELDIVDARTVPAPGPAAAAVPAPAPAPEAAPSPEPEPSPAPVSQPLEASAFISSDRTQYRIGDVMTITFGADKLGYVYLFLVGPDGERSLLGPPVEVDGQRFYQVKGKVTNPGGRHMLVAVYGEKQDLPEESFIIPEPKETYSKGIVLFDQKMRPYAVYHLNIKDGESSDAQ